MQIRNTDSPTVCCQKEQIHLKCCQQQMFNFTIPSKIEWIPEGEFLYHAWSMIEFH